MAESRALCLALFAMALVVTLGAFVVFWGCFGLPWGTALTLASMVGAFVVVSALRGQTQTSEPDASGSVDRNVTPAGPLTNGDAPEAQGSAGGGVEVGSEVVRA